MDQPRSSPTARAAKARVRGRAALALGVLAALLAGTASAQSMRDTGASYKYGYGWSSGQLNAGVDVSTRDASGNRIMVDGITQIGSDQSVFSTVRTSGAVDAFSGVGAIGGGATAIGNNLQVSVSGNYNTVIVSAQQSNTGAVTASSILNGKVDIDGK